MYDAAILDGLLTAIVLNQALKVMNVSSLCTYTVQVLRHVQDDITSSSQLTPVYTHYLKDSELENNNNVNHSKCL